jgi:hypothetical protein
MHRIGTKQVVSLAVVHLPRHCWNRECETDLVRVMRVLAIVLVCNECINLPAKNKRSRTRSHYLRKVGKSCVTVKGLMGSGTWKFRWKYTSLLATKLMALAKSHGKTIEFHLMVF